MSYPIEIPKVVTAGVNVEFAMRAYDLVGTELTVAGGYTLIWALSNATANYSVSSQTENDQGFLISAPYAITSAWTAGDYSSVVYAEDGTNRYNQSSQFVTIQPSLDDSVEARSTYRQIRDALDAAILGQATSGQLAMSIAGRSIQRMSLEDLTKAKAMFDSLVASEDNVSDMLDGKQSSNTIRVEFK